MPSDQPEPPPVPRGGSGGRKMQKMLMSAFKRGGSGSGESSSAWDDVELSRSGSGSGSSSTSAASSGRHPSGRRSVRGSVDGDRSSAELDGSKNGKVLAALRDAKIMHAYETFPWEKKMAELLPVPASSCFLSLLLLPKAATDGTRSARYNTVEDTLARAAAWLASSQASGVPVAFASVQTEALLTKISGETALSTVNMGSLSDLADMANSSLYGFEDYHGVDIGVVRAVRLWYAPAGRGGEAALEIAPRAGDTRLGFAISRTEEGFIYVSSVAAEDDGEGTPAARSGLVELHRAARRASRALVVSRVGGEKVLPWMVSTGGDVKCFDTVSLSQKLSLHRHALRPITLHFLMWDDADVAPGGQVVAARPPSPVQLMLPAPPPPPTTVKMDEGDHQDAGLDSAEIAGGGGGGRGSSFRFQNIDLLPDSWL